MRVCWRGEDARRDERGGCPAQLEAQPVRPYSAHPKVTVSVDDEVISRARRRAEALGTSVEQLVREYVEQLAGKVEFAEDADAWEGLS